MKMRAYGVTRWTRFAGVITDARRASRSRYCRQIRGWLSTARSYHGLQVELPDIATTSTVQTVQLWD